MGYYCKVIGPVGENIYLRFPSKSLHLPVILEPDNQTDTFTKVEVPLPVQDV